ncbi:hypothetical protein C9374_009298 [Naegleria lovaniensis]|uniref:Uncharacterized protein n=1 Tax=Naegleria lovaniensis TaxID=51637 RepID=A0AA88GHB4_NAELO|nr:uncharacterized protein C9374_009298 [Naegleria lovaniensis]KAG2377387.1 hypothetical protein C9374_009298 [Naegleria lovaniensis]
MGVNCAVRMCNIQMLEDAVRKRLELAQSKHPVVADQKNEEKVEKEDDEVKMEKFDWKLFVLEQKPKHFIDCLRFRAVHLYCELAEKLKLGHCWSNENEFKNFFTSLYLFEQDLAKEYVAKNGTTSAVPVTTENLRYPNLLSVCRVYNENKSVFGMGFVHPSRLAQLSERLDHCSYIPSTVLQEAFMQDYKDKYLKNLKKGRKSERMTFEEWVFDEYDYISFFFDIALRYNDPASFCMLLPKTPIDNSQPTVKLFEKLDVNFSDLADEYWFTIMEFIEDPFTLVRFAKGNTVLFRIFTERKDALFRNFQHLKADIGLFCYLY